MSLVEKNEQNGADEAQDFDTHHFVKQLTEAGMDEKIAEILAAAQLRQISRNMATKSDIARLESNMATKENLAKLGNATKEDIAKLGTFTSEEIKRLELKIAELKAEFSQYVTRVVFAGASVTILVLGLEIAVVGWLIVSR